MKLLFISNLYPPVSIGGYEESCYDVAQGLKKRGHEVLVLTSGFQADKIRDPEPGVFRCLKTNSNWRLPSNGATPWIERNNLVMQWQNFGSLRRALVESRPDAVMFWNASNIGRALVLVPRPSRNTFFYLQDMWLEPYVRPIVRRRQSGRRIYLSNGIKTGGIRLLAACINSARSENLIFVSRSLQSEYTKRGSEVTASRVIYNGVSQELFPTDGGRRSLRDRQGGIKVLYAGRISPEKGVTTLLRAIHQLRRTSAMQGVTLSLLGVIQGGHYGAELRQLVTDLGLEGAVTFLPRQQRCRLPALYRQHDVLVFPSEWEEPFGLTLIEAMSVALPVVSTDRGAASEIVSNGRTGLTFKAGDAQDLASKLLWLSAHAVEADALGAAASAEVKERFTLEIQVESIEAYLESRVRRTWRG